MLKQTQVLIWQVRYYETGTQESNTFYLTIESNIVDAPTQIVTEMLQGKNIEELTISFIARGWQIEEMI